MEFPYTRLGRTSNTGHGDLASPFSRFHSERESLPGNLGTMEMQTQRLSLVSLTREEVIAEVEAMNPEDGQHLSADWLALLRGSTGADPWIHGFTLVSRETGTTVGRCGFKGPPAPDGLVEIAYGIEATQQGKGYATEAVKALVTFAFESGRVGQVRAHTLPMENASTKVLAKCGFTRVGEIVDPENGLVWRWAKNSERIDRT